MASDAGRSERATPRSQASSISSPEAKRHSSATLPITDGRPDGSLPVARPVDSVGGSEGRTGDDPGELLHSGSRTDETMASDDHVTAFNEQAPLLLATDIHLGIVQSGVLLCLVRRAKRARPG